MTSKDLVLTSKKIIFIVLIVLGSHHVCDGVHMVKTLDKPSEDSFSPRVLRLPQESPRTGDKSLNGGQAERRTDTSPEVKIFVDSEKITGPLEHIWRSTGLCPPAPHSEAHTFLLSQDEKLNLAMVGSLPNDAVTQVRIHWLFDLIDASIDQSEPRYNYTHLDDLMDILRQHDLKPGFEIMGNPGNIFNDLENSTQISWWRHLVAHTAARYVDRYGLDWVSSWNWETWNEPDHHDFDTLNFTVQGFLNYYDASRMGLDDVSPRLVFGGPGGSCRNPGFSKICWALLEHCNNGSSLFTPGKPPRVDFISFHHKGQEDADTILEWEIPTVNQIYNQYPSLRQVPVMNDEADFRVGWSTGLEWRADVRYAALAVRSIFIHQRAKSSIPHFNYTLMSFDNAFLNYRPSFFDQRTLLARFQINSTDPPQVQFVKKPAYTIMSLLSLLGDKMLNHTNRSLDDRISVLSTCRNCDTERSVGPTSLKEAKTKDLEKIASKVQSPESVTDSKIVKETSSELVDPKRPNKNGREKENQINKKRVFLLDGRQKRGNGIRDLLIHDEIVDRGDFDLASGRQNLKSMEGDSGMSLIHSQESFMAVDKGLTGDESSTTYSNYEEREAEFSSYSHRSEGESDLKNASSTDNIMKDTKSGNPESEDLSTMGAWESTLFVSSSNGTEKIDDDIMKVKIEFALPKFLVGKDLSVATYRLRGNGKGPYEAWLELGRPIEPNRTELAYMRSFEGSLREGPNLLHSVPPSLSFKANLTLPEVLVIHLCYPSKSNPGQVTNVNTVRVTRADVLITWSDALIITRCVLYYEVQRSQTDRDGPYLTISNHNVTDNNFMYSLPQLSGSATVAGWYRVRVMTYWGSAGPFSDPVYHIL